MSYERKVVVLTTLMMTVVMSVFFSGLLSFLSLGLGDGLWAIATVATLVASILLMGSLIRNPALPGAAKQTATAEACGVYGITRHPMLWSFAILGASHILVLPVCLPPSSLRFVGHIILQGRDPADGEVSARIGTGDAMAEMTRSGR